MKDIMETVLNPVRMRILQYLIVHGQGTPGEIRKSLTDIPSASLYRHLRILLDAGLICVAGERPVRGAVEKIYALVPNPAELMEKENAAAMIRSGLLSLLTAFQQYFDTPGRDPEQDMLCFSASTLMLTDDEYRALLTGIGCLVQKEIGHPPGNGRKIRRLSLISSPCETEKRFAFPPENDRTEKEHAHDPESHQNL